MTAPIVSSTFLVGTPQSDGRSYVIETHTRNDLSTTIIEYGPIERVAYQAIADSRAQSINQAEITQAVVLAAEAQSALKVSTVLTSAITAGSITAADLQLVGIPVPQNQSQQVVT